MSLYPQEVRPGPLSQRTAAYLTDMGQQLSRLLELNAEPPLELTDWSLRLTNNPDVNSPLSIRIVGSSAPASPFNFTPPNANATTITGIANWTGPLTQAPATPFYAVLGAEFVLVTAVAADGTTWTVARGQWSTVAYDHSALTYNETLTVAGSVLYSWVTDFEQPSAPGVWQDVGPQFGLAAGTQISTAQAAAIILGINPAALVADPTSPSGYTAAFTTQPAFEVAGLAVPTDGSAVVEAIPAPDGQNYLFCWGSAPEVAVNLGTYQQAVPPALLGGTGILTWGIAYASGGTGLDDGILLTRYGRYLVTLSLLVEPPEFYGPLTDTTLQEQVEIELYVLRGGTNIVSLWRGNGTMAAQALQTTDGPTYQWQWYTYPVIASASIEVEFDATGLAGFSDTDGVLRVRVLNGLSSAEPSSNLFAVYSYGTGGGPGNDPQGVAHVSGSFNARLVTAFTGQQNQSPVGPPTSQNLIVQGNLTVGGNTTTAGLLAGTSASSGAALTVSQGTPSTVSFASIPTIPDTLSGFY